jgi:predicted DNA-binding protein
MPYSKPMKLVTFWLTEEEKVRLDELTKDQDITLSYAMREGLKLYFEDAKDWIEERQGEGRRAKPA